MELKVGNIIELAHDNELGVGKKGDKGKVLYKLYEPVDGWNYMVKLYNGATEAFLEKDLKIAAKKLDKFVLVW